MVIPRDQYTEKHFHYKPGEHVVFGGPTQRGKTTLAFDLLKPIVSPDFPAYVAVSKPDDKTTATKGQALGFQRVTQWPAPRKVSELWDGKPSGYLVWPKFGDLDTDMERCGYVTARLMGDRYTQGVRGKRGILVMDDTMVKSKIMGLDRQMTTIIAMAGAMGIGMWVFVQKPTDTGRTPLWAYDNAEHIFLTKGGDRRMRQRYSEIAGVDGKIVMEVIPTLKPFQFLYIKKTEEYICIVDSD